MQLYFFVDNLSQCGIFCSIILIKTILLLFKKLKNTFKKWQRQIAACTIKKIKNFYRRLYYMNKKSNHPFKFNHLFLTCIVLAWAVLVNPIPAKGG